jgi:hypothetical protein
MSNSPPELAPGRECGACTACCKIPRIDVPALLKPAGVMCPNCSGSNCSIYEARPEPCRTFFCLWRKVATMPEELRPDRIGVMFTIEVVAQPQNPFEREFVIGRAIDSLADFESPGARRAIQTFIERGDLPVWLSFQQERRLLHPYPALRDAILRPGVPPAELADQVRLWRGRLGLANG